MTLDDVFSDLDDKIRQYAKQGYVSDEYVCDGVDLRKRAPNAVVWITAPQYLNVPSLYQHVRQYEIVRDFFQLRCPICNKGKGDCWGKSEADLRSEVLLEWDQAQSCDVCPKCGMTRAEFIEEGLLFAYDNLVGIAGMRSGKSVVAGMIGTYMRHVFITMGIQEQGWLHKRFGLLPTQALEMAFVATTSTQSSQTIWANFKLQCSTSPWFQAYVRWVKAKEDQQLTPDGMRRWTYKELEEGIEDGYLLLNCMNLNSNSSGMAGRTRLAYFLDELSRFGLGESRFGADEVWAVFSNSLKTVRGARSRLRLPDVWLGASVTISSPISIEDKTMVLHAQGAHEPTTYCWKYATWEFNPFLTRDVFDVDFLKDPVVAERDFGANPPNATTPLVTDPHRFWSAIDETAKPTATFSITNPVDGSGRPYVGGQLEHASLDRGRPLYIFGDAGKTFDQFALVACSAIWLPAFSTYSQEERNSMRDTSHLAMHHPMETMYHNPNTAEPDAPEMTLITVQEWSLRIIPEQGKPVWFESVIQIFKALNKVRRIATIAFDRWNSESTIQQISDMGIGARIISLKVEDFTKAVQDAMLGRLKLLPPKVPNEIYLEPSGTLRLTVSPDKLSSEAATLYEMLKLERSEDLKSVFNPRKGVARGVDSDDLAHCMVGAHRLVQESTGILMSEQQRREMKRSKEVGGSSHFTGVLTRYTRW